MVLCCGTLSRVRLRRRAIFACAALAVLAAAAGGAGAPVGAGASARAPIFTGLGFESCTAPSLSALGAWLASPYRAVGIYIGGVNRACPDGNLSASWVASAKAGGWSLLPLYVGLQAPCVGRKHLALIDPGSAASQGAAAADDAADRALAVGLAPGDPIYFDMEGYATDDAACSQVVQSFLSAWVGALRGLGYTAGVYGSAASTIRDLVALASGGAGPVPDDVWIAHWNGKQSVFGDPYVPDSYWTDHQRLHQYVGGHDETYGDVTLNIDSDAVDAAVSRLVSAPAAGGASPAGSAATGDGQATVTWPAGAFSEPATVTLTASALQRAYRGFAAGSYLVQLSTVTAEGGAPLTRFVAPLSIRFRAPQAGVVPAFSSDSKRWTALLRLPSAKLPAGAIAGYICRPDGSVVVQTLAPGWFGLLRDVAPPIVSGRMTGRFVGKALLLAWPPARDNSGTVTRYQILLDGTPVATASGTRHASTLHLNLPRTRSVFRIAASDAAGNRSAPSRALLVVPRPRPAGVPRVIPAWAWRLLAWQRGGRTGRRPPTPHPVPRWYWRWASWQKQPLRVANAPGR